MGDRRKALTLGVIATVTMGIGGAVAYAKPRSDVVAVPSTTSTSTTDTTTATVDATGAEVIPAETVNVPTTAPAAAPDSPESIKSSQQRLLDLGYWISTPDGEAGSGTQQAVLAFQKVEGLKRTGILDEATKVALTKANRPRPASSSGDLIEIDKGRQVIFVVRGGAVLWTINTSTGTEKKYVTDGQRGVAHTPTGGFRVLWAVDGVRHAPLGALYRPRYFTAGGIAIHGSASIPGYPASHGCARVSNSAMDMIWGSNLMPLGSTVWVYQNPTDQSPVTTTTGVPETTSTTTAIRETTTTTTQAPPATTSTTTLL